MNASRHPRTGPSNFRLIRRALTVVALVASSMAVFSPAPVSAAPQNLRIDLKVLVLDDGSGSVAAIKSQMQTEGVPFHVENISSVTVNALLLTGLANPPVSTATRSLYQAVVVPDSSLSQLSSGEKTTLRDWRTRFGIRQVDAWDSDVNAYSTIGLSTPTYDGNLDGATAQVTAAGQAAGFGYLNGPVPFTPSSYAHISQPASAAYTSLVDTQPPGGGTSGSILGVYSSGGTEQMVITPGFDFTFLQFKYLGHGIITWMTRGVHFGYNRNNFTMHFDDAFAPDSLWDPTLDCTPGEDCAGTEVLARMTPADIAVAAAWTQANGYQFTLAFNGFYANNEGSDPQATAAFVANKSAFRWLNHGYEHIYQGCLQNTTSIPWVCQLDGSLPPQPVPTPVSTILNEINTNISVGQSLGLTFDVHEYLSGEHSGLAFTNPAVPGQNQGDNQNFITAMNQTGMFAIGTDASRETGSRVVGTATNTIPRHPTALFYNNATRAQAIDEYNWFYAAAPAGSGACGTTVPPCITPLTTDSQFDSYIVPTDAAFDLGFILSNDPRPFYAHTSNLTGGVSALAYPLLDSILGTLHTVFTPATPVVNLSLTQAAQQLMHQQQWAADSATVTGYVLNGAISITNGSGHAVPFTAPTGTTIVNNTLEPYGGESSAWLTAATSYSGALPAPALITTGSNIFPVGTSGAITFSVASNPSSTVTVAPVSGNLPNWMTYTPTAGAATIAGTAPVSATGTTYPIKVTVVTAGYNNLVDTTENAMLTLTVPSVPAITSAGTATAIAGKPFTFTVTTSGIPAPAIAITAGSLPAGITLTDNHNGTATIAGTAADALGGQSYPITLVATNVAGASVPQSFTLVLDRVPQFTSATTASAVVGAPFSFAITTLGTPTPAITKSGALPTGFTFTPLGNGTATLTGTAVLADVDKSFPIALTATSSAGVGHQAFTLSVTRKPVFTSAASATALSANPFSFMVGVVGSPMPTMTMSGSLPAVAFTDLGNGQASLTGMPGKAAAGHSFTVTFTATNAFGTTQQTFTLTVNPDTALESVTPARLADTRAGSSTVDGKFAGEGIREAGTTLVLDVAGRGPVPADAAAVALNVTVAGALGSGFVTVYPCGSDQPLASSLNFTAGAVVPNAVIAKLGGGQVCLFVSNATHLIVDVNGYFSSASTFTSMNPARLLETRSGPGYATIDGVQQGEGMRGQNTVTTLNVVNRAGIPSDAAAVVLNVTVTEAQGPGFVTVYPCGDIPTASSINYATGSTVANMVIAKVGPDGTVCLYNNEAAHLVVDVNGYFPGDGSYQPINPARFLETRPGMKTIDLQSNSGALLANGTVTELLIAGRDVVPGNAKTVVLNVTVTESAVPGFITVYPCGIDIPTASNLNYGVGTTVAGAVIAQIPSSGNVCLFNSGATHLIADVNGYLVN